MAEIVPSGPGPGGSPLPGDVQSLIAYANEHFQLAETARLNGDIARYAAEVELARQAVAQLLLLTGGASPAPSAAP